MLAVLLGMALMVSGPVQATPIQVGEISYVMEETGDVGETVDETTTDEEEITFEEIWQQLQDSNWWKGIATAGISWIATNVLTIVGLAIGLLRTRAKKVSQDLKYQKDIALIANTFKIDLNSKIEALQSSFDLKLTEYTNKTTEALKKAGLEKSAAEFVAGTKSGDAIDKIIEANKTE